MSRRKDDFPRDLRGMLGGKEQDDDGSIQKLFFPIRGYSNLVHVSNETAAAIEDPLTRPEDIPSLKKDLKAIQQELVDMENRIINHFLPSTDGSRVDHGAKSKIEKGLNDAKAGKYNFHKHSKTLKAIFSAFDFFLKNSRMPSYGELKARGHNDQEVCDAGDWLKTIKLCDSDSGNDELKLKDAREHIKLKK